MTILKKNKDPHAEREAQKYEHPIPSREFILSMLNEYGRPATQTELVRELALTTAEEEEALRRRLLAMVRDGQLLKNRRDAYGPLSKMELIMGRVIGHRDGFGFFEPESGGEDLFLSPRQMRMVFHGDRVLVRAAGMDARGKREAIIVEVLERSMQTIVGRFCNTGGVQYVEPVHRRLTQEIFIPAGQENGAQNGQMVIVAITTYPTKTAKALGEITEILGDHMAPGMEIKVAIRNHVLPYLWPTDVEQEMEIFPTSVTPADKQDREDLRQYPFVTIDGEDAKDFDDAVLCQPKKGGGWQLWVAIADVSHYVRPHSALDKEALNRGNSVYFPGRVIPMLPEGLSNDLCSLNPTVERLVMVCEMTINATGRIVRYRFTEGVIKSAARLTYKIVHDVMEARTAQACMKYKQWIPVLEPLYDLFRVLRKARTQRGAIDFDLPETRIIFGSDRKIEKIVPYERFDSHRVIEECMLCANICAARYLKKHKQPGLYRVHEGPTDEKLKDLRCFLSDMGFHLPATAEAVAPMDYARILQAVANRPDAHFIQTVLLRSMSQAIYGPDNKGHFGLAFEAYAHFTSPIRRYPDLLVHRAIKSLLSRTAPPATTERLAKIGEHCSMTERRADEATREVQTWLKCEFMMDKIGQVFTGTISGVMHFGIFVELSDIYVEGLVHISALPEDYYRFDHIKHTLQGERTRQRFRLGDKVTVQVARVDLDQQQIDFVLDASTLMPPSKKSSRTRTRKK